MIGFRFEVFLACYFGGMRMKERGVLGKEAECAAVKAGWDDWMREIDGICAICV